MIFFGFIVISHEDVGRKSAVGDDATDGCHAVEIPLTGIFTVHELQYLVGATLYWQVYLFADVWHIGNHV